MKEFTNPPAPPGYPRNSRMNHKNKAAIAAGDLRLLGGDLGHPRRVAISRRRIWRCG